MCATFSRFCTHLTQTSSPSVHVNLAKRCNKLITNGQSVSQHIYETRRFIRDNYYTYYPKPDKNATDGQINMKVSVSQFIQLCYVNYLSYNLFITKFFRRRACSTNRTQYMHATSWSENLKRGDLKEVGITMEDKGIGGKSAEWIRLVQGTVLWWVVTINTVSNVRVP